MRPLLRRLRGARAPWFFTWALTDRCNYTCDHCGCWRAPGDELRSEDALRYARQMVAMGVLGVNLCGGEVLLRKDVGEVIATLRDGGVITRITTNGKLVPARIAELSRLNRIKMSLDGPPDLHDQVRGEGAFAALVAALEAARSVGVGVQLNTVLTRDVLARLDEVLDTAGSLGVTVSFNPLELRHDVAAPGVNEARPDPQVYRDAIARLRAGKRAGDRRIANSDGTLAVLARWPDPSPTACRAGARFGRVLSDGRVVACDRSYAPHPPPPPGSVAPDFATQVQALSRAGHCAQGCWRNNTIELNRALGGRPASALSTLRWS